MTLGEYEERFPEAPLVSEECSRRTSDAISEAKLGVPVWTEERKKEWSERVSGEGNPSFASEMASEVLLLPLFILT